jgi:hypothetical protein
MTHINAYTVIDVLLPEVLKKLEISFNMDGFSTSIGDKSQQYLDELAVSGIPRIHAILMHALTYIPPYSNECRATPNGWVAPIDWIKTKYELLKLVLPSATIKPYITIRSADALKIERLKNPTIVLALSASAQEAARNNPTVSSYRYLPLTMTLKDDMDVVTDQINDLQIMLLKKFFADYYFCNVIVACDTGVKIAAVVAQAIYDAMPDIYDLTIPDVGKRGAIYNTLANNLRSYASGAGNA